MSDVTISLGMDASQMETGAARARSALKSLDAQANQRGIFERLNNDVKNVGAAFATLREQLAGGNVIGALATVSKTASGMAGGMGAMLPILGGVGLGLAGVAVAANGMWSAMSRAREMKEIADSSGLLVTELMPLQKIFGRVGIEADQVPVIMTHLREAMLTLGDPASKTSQAFAKIGLSAASFKDKSYYESLKIIGSALASAKDKTDALNASTEAFGAKKGTKVGVALAGADFSKMEAQTPQSAQITQDQADQFAKFQIAIARLKPSLDGFFLGMSSKIIPSLEDAASKIEKLDLVGIGKKFGEHIANGITKATELGERLKFVMATPAERKQMQAEKVREYEEERKRQLIPGYAEANQPAKPVLYDQPPAPASAMERGALADTGIAKISKERNEPIMASIAKMGGGASGMGAEGLDIQREQLSVMRQMLQALGRSKESQGKASMINIYGNSDIAVTA